MRRLLTGVLLAAPLCGAAMVAPARAQDQTVDTSKPIVVRVNKPKSAQHEKFKGEVIVFTAAAITVRSQNDERLIRTFSYSDAVRDAMQQILDRGGYQYGDKVIIECEKGSNVALRVRGKPTRPI